ncbi:MAG TPA: NAD(P)-dependent oxidoreductase, partial [Burkholderiaceae bacterium]|nr:NAD(P)-dependent oxidoreductase [Burkholderiaceae bacterium]
MQHIGFIGASGLMGHGIAKNLLAKGFGLSLTVHHNRERVADLLAAGAREAAGPKTLGQCDVVILCVTGTPQVEQCLLGDDGLLAHAKPGMVIIDTSTSEPESTLRLGDLCATRGVTLVDAPLARSAPEAELGKHNTMVGASPEVFARIEPVFQAYCENIFHLGGPRSGHTI